MKKWIIALLAIGSLAAAALTIHKATARTSVIASVPINPISQEMIHATDQSARNIDVPPVYDVVNFPLHEVRQFQLARGEDAIVASPGDLIHFHIRGTLKEGWFTYAFNPDSKWNRGNKIILGENGVARIAGEILTTPPPTLDKSTSEVFGEDTYSFRGEVIYDIPVRVSPDAADGRTVLRLKMYSTAFCSTM